MRLRRGDNAFKPFSQMLFHIFRLITVLAVPFHRHRPELGFARMGARGLDELCKASFQLIPRFTRRHRGEDPVNRKVWVPPDGRGKVRVVFQRKPIMADVFLLILCFCHRTEHGVVDRQLKRRAPGVIEDFIERPRRRPGLNRRIRQPGRRQKFAERFQLFPGGRFMHPVNERDLRLHRKGRGRLVCRKHEFFNHLFRPPAGPRDYIFGAAVFTDQDFRFGRRKIHRPPREPPLFEDLRKFPHPRYLIGQAGVFCEQFRIRIPFKDPVHLAVNALDARANDAFPKLISRDFAVRVQLQQRREREPVLTGVERTDPVREGGRQHRDHRVREIHRSPARKRLPVDRRLFPNIIANVRDVHPERPTIPVLFHRNRVVDIFGVRAVNGKDRRASEIEPPLQLSGPDPAAGDLFRLRRHLGREPARDAVGGEDRFTAVLR